MVFKFRSLQIQLPRLCRFAVFQYAKDGFIKADLLTTLKILADLKHAFKMDLDMDLTLHNFEVLLPGISQAEAHAAIRLVIESHPHLSNLSCMVSDDDLAQQTVGDRPMVISDMVKTDGLVWVGISIVTPDLRAPQARS